jgi:hypothetical protein
MSKPHPLIVHTSIDCGIYMGREQIGAISARQGRCGFTAHDAAGRTIGRFDRRAQAVDAIIAAHAQKETVR